MAVRTTVNETDGNILASGSDDGKIRLLDSKRWDTFALLTEHREGVTDLAWSSDSQKLASTSFDKTVRIWQLQRLVANSQELKGHTSAVYCLSWLSTQPLLVSSGNDNTICIWNLSLAKPARVLEGHTDRVTSVSICADGSFTTSKSKDSWHRTIMAY